MWDGRPPDIRSEVTYFKDTPQATFARVRVQNTDGLPVVYEREFIFVKNRFLATREIVTFEESFKARVAPLWNTHNIGPQIGSHWANTFIHAPIDDNGNRSLKTPPADLLVWFAPRADCRLQIVDRLESDPRTESCPNQVRYLWEGTPAVGEKLVFTQVYYPHPPYRSRTVSNNPGSKGSLRQRTPGHRPRLRDQSHSRRCRRLQSSGSNSKRATWSGWFSIRKPSRSKWIPSRRANRMLMSKTANNPQG